MEELKKCDKKNRSYLEYKIATTEMIKKMISMMRFSRNHRCIFLFIPLRNHFFVFIVVSVECSMNA